MNKDLLSYAMEFVSFFIDGLDEKDLKNIKEVILFGSVARGNAEKDSDVDIFVNIIRQDNIEKKVDILKKNFYDSKIYKKWELRGIENSISIIIDRLEKWKDLKTSIISDGIVLYSKYVGTIKGEQKVIFYWGTIENQSRRVLLSKKLYGYSYKKLRYKGLLELIDSEKLGPNTIIVNLENAKKVVEIFNELKIDVKRIHINKI